MPSTGRDSSTRPASTATREQYNAAQQGGPGVNGGDGQQPTGAQYGQDQQRGDGQYGSGQHAAGQDNGTGEHYSVGGPPADPQYGVGQVGDAQYGGRYPAGQDNVTGAHYSLGQQPGDIQFERPIRSVTPSTPPVSTGPRSSSQAASSNRRHSTAPLRTLTVRRWPGPERGSVRRRPAGPERPRRPERQRRLRQQAADYQYGQARQPNRADIQRAAPQSGTPQSGNPQYAAPPVRSARPAIPVRNRSGIAAPSSETVAPRNPAAPSPPGTVRRCPVRRCPVRRGPNVTARSTPPPSPSVHVVRHRPAPRRWPPRRRRR